MKLVIHYKTSTELLYLIKSMRNVKKEEITCGTYWFYLCR